MVNWSKLHGALEDPPDFGGRVVIDASTPIEPPLFKPADLRERSSSEIFGDPVPAAAWPSPSTTFDRNLPSGDSQAERRIDRAPCINDRK